MRFVLACGFLVALSACAERPPHVPPAAYSNGYPMGVKFVQPYPINDPPPAYMFWPSRGDWNN